MATFLALLAISLPSQGGGEVDAAQFSRLVCGQLAELRDVTLLYEGELNYVGPANLLNEPVVSQKQSYQGVFRFRSDNAALVDVYVHKYDNNGNMLPLVRNTFSYAKKFKQRLTRVPDLKQIFTETLPSGPNCLFATSSYGRIFFHWYFLAMKDPLDSGYVCLGWEKVNGRNCLKVQFDALGKPMPKDNPIDIFWIDLERGSLPLKHEYREGKTLISCNDEIKLMQFEGKDGKKVWLPYSGRDVSYGFGGRPDGKPLFIETYYIVTGSARVNEGLTDEDLSVKAKVDVAGSAGLSAERDLSEAFTPAPPGRSDPASVKARLNEQLAEADRQSKEIEASSLARDSWSAVTVVQGVVISFGVILVVVAIVWKVKRG